jgi:hypothetical protein
MVMLVNSICLVCIALGRYMAVKKVKKVSWELSKLSSIASCLFIWIFSAAVSSPLLRMYDYFTLYVVPSPNDVKNDTSFSFYNGFMCNSDKVSLILTNYGIN